MATTIGIADVIIICVPLAVVLNIWKAISVTIDNLVMGHSEKLYSYKAIIVNNNELMTSYYFLLLVNWQQLWLYKAGVKCSNIYVVDFLDYAIAFIFTIFYRLLCGVIIHDLSPYFPNYFLVNLNALFLPQIGLDGIRMLDPSTSRTLRIYPLDTITRCEVCSFLSSFPIL